MRTFVASKNAGKIRELREIFAGSPLEIETFSDYADVEEDAGSYVGNAMKKARALVAQLAERGVNAAVLADDSGIEVEALGGRPGILSARYAGVKASWPQRRHQLLTELDALPEKDRGARFVCVMTLLVPEKEPLVSIGVVEGRIVSKERGKGGFGYDPIFLYPATGCTFAELSADEKNAISHRNRAAEAMLAILRDRA